MSRQKMATDRNFTQRQEYRPRATRYLLDHKDYEVARASSDHLLSNQCNPVVDSKLCVEGEGDEVKNPVKLF